jgi:hypothetical protein
MTSSGKHPRSAYGENARNNQGCEYAKRHIGAGGCSCGRRTKIPAGNVQSAGDAAEQLLPLVYCELRRLAAARMALERDEHTLEMMRILIDDARRKSRLKNGGDQMRLGIEDLDLSTRGP